MKTVLLFLCVFSCSLFASAQSLKKYPIGKSGCSLYNYCVSKYTLDYSEDSSKVYTGECTRDGVTYGVICIQLRFPVTDLEEAEELMLNYLVHLKSSLNIIKAAGYGRGLRLDHRENTRGVLDYWQDNTGDQWKIKSWTDGNFIGFMYAYSSAALPETKVNVFLDGFRLPGM